MYLDLLLSCRGILALNVFFWHISLTSKYVLPGRISVILFFGISAYSILVSLETKEVTFSNIILFIKKRIYRVYPVFFLSSVLMLLISPEISLPLNTTNVFTQFLFLQFNHNYLFNGVFWTLGIEFQYYLIAPFLILFTRYVTSKKPIYHILIYIILSSIPTFFALIMQDLKQIDSRNLIGNLSHFYISFIAYDIVNYYKNINFNKTNLTLVIFFILGICTFLYYELQIFFWTLGSVLLDLVIILLIILHKSNIQFSNTTSKKIIIKFLTFLGKMSFGIYAYHYFVFNLIDFENYRIFSVTIVTLFFSYLSYNFFEPFFIKKGKSLIYN